MFIRGMLIPVRWFMPADEQPQGGQSQSGQGAGDPPQGVTLEQVNEVVNKAISARNKQIDAKVEKLFTDFGAKLDEKFASLKPAEPDPSTQKPPTETPEFKAIQRQLADLNKQLEKERQEKSAADDRARAQSLRQKVQDGLTAGGISGKSLHYALGVLLDSEKRVRFDDDGQRVLFKGEDGDELPLADGLKSWLKSEDAKVFLPPRGTTGSGQRPGGSAPTNGNAPAQPGQLGQRIASVLFGPNATSMAED